jgi:hypothetical protein
MNLYTVYDKFFKKLDKIIKFRYFECLTKNNNNNNNNINNKTVNLLLQNKE